MVDIVKMECCCKKSDWNRCGYLKRIAICQSNELLKILFGELKRESLDQNHERWLDTTER